MLLSEGAQLLGVFLMFKKERTDDGKIERYKARVVAQGYLQTFGVDSFDTFKTIVCLTPFVSFVLGISVQRDLETPTLT